MREVLPWRCRVLSWLRLHGRVWTRDAGTPVPHDYCVGCGRMFKRPSSSSGEGASR